MAYSYQTQQVKVRCLSDVKALNTGVPQGCTSSLLLFTLHTNDCRDLFTDDLLFGFSDDAAVLSLAGKDCSLTSYFAEIQGFVEWCDKNQLNLSIKTQETVWNYSPVFIHNIIFKVLS